MQFLSDSLLGLTAALATRHLAVAGTRPDLLTYLTLCTAVNVGSRGGADSPRVLSGAFINPTSRVDFPLGKGTRRRWGM